MNVAVSVPSTTRTVAEFAVTLRYEDLPAEVISAAKQCILDSLGCGGDDGQAAQARRRPVCQCAWPRGLAGRRPDGFAIWRYGEALPLRQGRAERHAGRAAGLRRIDGRAQRPRSAVWRLLFDLCREIRSRLRD